MSVDTLDSNLSLSRTYDGLKFLGKVVENKDPLNLDRVQIRVEGLYDPDEGQIPWAGPVKLSPFGIGSGFGVYGVPAVGADVIVTLQNGDPHYPMYESILRHANADYPSGTTWGFVDPIGNKAKFDLEAKTVTITTNDGVVFATDGEGNLTVTVPGTTTVNSVDDMVLHSDADVHITAGGNTFIQSGTHTVTADTVNNGKLTTNGNVASTGTVTNNGINVGSTHRHGGVRSGSDTSGTPT